MCFFPKGISLWRIAIQNNQSYYYIENDFCISFSSDLLYRPWTECRHSAHDKSMAKAGHRAKLPGTQDLR